MKKSKAQSKRSSYTPDPQLIGEVQSVLRGRIFHGDVPLELRGLDEQKRFVSYMFKLTPNTPVCSL